MFLPSTIPKQNACQAGSDPLTERVKSLIHAASSGFIRFFSDAGAATGTMSRYKYGPDSPCGVETQIACESRASFAMGGVRGARLVTGQTRGLKKGPRKDSFVNGCTL